MGYFWDGWNVLDFVVVVVGSIIPLAVRTSSVSSIRALRILRAIRTIPRVPSKCGTCLIRVFEGFCRMRLFVYFQFDF